jgi:hypothetical protein
MIFFMGIGPLNATAAANACPDRAAGATAGRVYRVRRAKANGKNSSRGHLAKQTSMRVA